MSLIKLSRRKFNNFVLAPGSSKIVPRDSDKTGVSLSRRWLRNHRFSGPWVWVRALSSDAPCSGHRVHVWGELQGSRLVWLACWSHRNLLVSQMLMAMSYEFEELLSHLARFLNTVILIWCLLNWWCSYHIMLNWVFPNFVLQIHQSYSRGSETKTFLPMGTQARRISSAQRET